MDGNHTTCITPKRNDEKSTDNKIDCIANEFMITKGAKLVRLFNPSIFHSMRSIIKLISGIFVGNDFIVFAHMNAVCVDDGIIYLQNEDGKK